MKTKYILSTAIFIIISSQFAFATEEVNPFNGAHGKIEKLKLEKETVHQENELIKEKADYERNKQAFDTMKNQFIVDIEASKKNTPEKVIEKEPKEVIAPAVVQISKPKPKPTAKLKLTGIIDDTEGKKAIITKGNKVWTVFAGSKVDNLTVKKVTGNKVVLSNGKVLMVSEQAHAVSVGYKEIAAGGVANNSSEIMGMPSARTPRLPQISPASFEN